MTNGIGLEGMARPKSGGTKMTPGPVEEAGKAAGVFMQIMKDQPLSLALVVMNVMLLGLFFYVIQTATHVRQTEMERIYAAQEKTNQLLYQCVPADRRSGYKLQSDESKPAELSHGTDDSSVHE
jgi:hypothetical protein